MPVIGTTAVVPFFGSDFMKKTYLGKEIVAIIRKEIKVLKEKNNVVNTILRNDVFALLESQDCTVLYYPLDDNIEGFRIRKYVAGKDEEFIYINTAKPEDIQIFTAAHELGHLINIDSTVCDAIALKNAPKKVREDIIDRFAAELLMDERTFITIFDRQAHDYVDDKGRISGRDMIKTIVFLMDFFMVPYDAVVHRLAEVGRIGENGENYLLNRENISESLIEKMIEEGKFKRLKPTGIKSFGELSGYLKKLDYAGEINERRMKEIMKIFGIREFEDIAEVESIQLEKETGDE